MNRRDNGLWAHPDFLRLWAAQTISFIGSQVTLVALPLTAVLALNASAAQMGILRALELAPALLVGLFVGALVDRLRRRPILIAADLGRALLLGTVPLAAMFGALGIYQLYIVALLVGVLNVCFDIAHMSLLPALVPRDRIVDGNSKLEVSRSLAMVAGPGLAGILVQLVTAPLAILADALSFLGSAGLLALIRAPEPPSERAKQPVWADVVGGLHVVWNERLLRTMALSLCVFNLFYNMIGTIYVLFVVRELQLSPVSLGLIYAVGSAGFPLGALFAGRVAQRFGVGAAIVWCAGISDAAFLLIPLAGGPPAVAIGILIVAQLLATLTGPITAINQLSLRQAITADRLQGRVNATIRTIALAAAPFGALLGGILGTMLGLRMALALSALGLQIGFLILLASPLRRITSQPETDRFDDDTS